MSRRNRKPYNWKQQGELANIIDLMLRRVATRPGSLQHNLIQAGAELNVKVTRIPMNKTLPMMGVCKQCGALRHLHAKCMCHRCYLAWWRRHRQGTCPQCGQQGLIYKSTGQCESCYKRVWYQSHKRQGECRECGRRMRIQLKGLRGTCYRKSISAYGPCVQCGQRKLLPFANKTTCAACASKLQRNKPQPIKEGTLK